MVHAFHNEADTRANLIDPALHNRGWTSELIRREQTPGKVLNPGGTAWRGRGRVDYVLQLPLGVHGNLVAVAVLEAKSEKHNPWKGFSQAKRYADDMANLQWQVNSKIHCVRFAYSTNGHRFIEYDRTTGMVRKGQLLTDFPSPSDLRRRYENYLGSSLDAPNSVPLVTPYSVPRSEIRHYQDGAIRSVLEGIAKGRKRMLLSMATGTGKTRVAVHVLKRLSDAGHLKRALFLCDRDVLRQQGVEAMRDVFGDNAAVASSQDPAVNARVIVATYQTLGISGDDDQEGFLEQHYPPDFFSHVIIDECHRSAWNKWSKVLIRNANAAHIGLTATPRHYKVQAEDTPDTRQDQKITLDNVRYFGEPVFEYQIGHAMEDGYLAGISVHRSDQFIGQSMGPEREVGVDKTDLSAGTAVNADTGEPASVAELPDHYQPRQIEERLILPDRAEAMCRHLFEGMISNGRDPHQKTIIYCVDVDHAAAVAAEMESIYAAFCASDGRKRANTYAFSCTYKSGSEQLPDFKGSRASHFVATTVDLLTTGVDVPAVENIVFFRYIASPITFHQIIGRGTRICENPKKLAFRIWDFTNATRLMGSDLIERARSQAKPNSTRHCEPEARYEVEGIQVSIRDGGVEIGVPDGEGGVRLVGAPEYVQMLRQAILKDHPDLPRFKEIWISPRSRKQLGANLLGMGLSIDVIRQISGFRNLDDYDVVAQLVFDRRGMSRDERSETFVSTAASWMASWPEAARGVVLAVASQFSRGGTEALESSELFSTPEVSRAGGVDAWNEIPALSPSEAMQEFKRRLFCGGRSAC